MQQLLPIAVRIGALLKERKETVAVSESSAGGLISAALLAVPGASVYFQGGGIIYTRIAGKELFDITREQVSGLRSSSEPYALFMARTVRTKLAATWGLCETGAAGPTGNGYGDAAGHSCFAIVGPVEKSMTLETGSPDRVANMRAFARGALELLEQHLK
jgi:nicotinamide-nucleotide amidase